MRLRVAVVYGGRTGEHEVSIRSAKAIMAGMDPAKYEIIEYFIDQQGKWAPGPILPEPGAHPGIDVVFPVLHGTFGEDGPCRACWNWPACHTWVRASWPRPSPWIRR